MPRKYKKRYTRTTGVPRNIKSYVNRTMAKVVEKKHIIKNMVSSFGSIPSTWIESDMSTTPQGDGVSEHVGRSLLLKSLEIRGVVNSSAVGNILDDGWNVLRVIVGLFDGSVSTPLQTAGISFNDAYFKSVGGSANLIKKYMDRYIALPVTGVEKGNGDGYTPGMKTFKYYKKFKKPIKITYSDGTSNYPDRRLIVACISDSGSVPHPGFVAGYMVARYVDA